MTDEKKENNQETEEKTEKTEEKSDVPNLKNRAEKITSAVYEQRKAELSEMETRLDKKMKDFRQLVDDAESQGLTTAGQPKKTPEDEAREQAEKDLNSFE